MKFTLVTALSLTVITAGGVASAQTQWVDEPQSPVIAPDLPAEHDLDGHHYPLDILKVDGVYHIYFSSLTDNGDGTNTLQVDHATSADGVIWDPDPANPVLRQGAEGEWDHGSIPGAAVIHDGSEFRMWYAAAIPGEYWYGGAWLGVGYATSHDGSSWAKYAGNPIIEPECPPSADISPMIPHSVILDEDAHGVRYRMWSTIVPMSHLDNTEVVISRDGLEWSNPYLPNEIAEGGWNHVETLSVDFDGTNYHMAYWNDLWFPLMYYAISEDGHHWSVPISSELPRGDSSRGLSPVVLADEDALAIWYRGWQDTGIYRATSDCCSTVYTRFIPAAAQGEGSRGSFYRTDAHLCNDGETNAEYRFAWFPRDRDNSDWIRSGFFNLGPRMCESYTGILEGVFGLEPGAFGALAVESSSQDLLLTAEILTSQSGTPTASFGQSLPIIPETESAGWDQRIVFRGDLVGARCNVSCFNLIPFELDLELNLYSADGAYLGTKTMFLPPRGSDQLNRIFDRYGVVGGYVHVFNTNSNYYCFGSVADNHSNAIKIIPPQ